MLPEVTARSCSVGFSSGQRLPCPRTAGMFIIGGSIELYPAIQFRSAPRRPRYICTEIYHDVKHARLRRFQRVRWKNAGVETTRARKIRNIQLSKIHRGILYGELPRVNLACFPAAIVGLRVHRADFCNHSSVHALLNQTEHARRFRLFSPVNPSARSSFPVLFLDMKYFELRGPFYYGALTSPVSRKYILAYGRAMREQVSLTSRNKSMKCTSRVLKLN